MSTASIYLRRSKASVDGQTVSFEFQERELRALLAGHGVTDVLVFKDDGKSGNNLERKPWLAWIESASKVEFLATWAIDRSSRGKAVLSLYPLLMALSVSGARLLTVRDRLDSADPRFERDVIWEAQRAHEDWLSYSEKAKATLRSLKASGKWPSGQAPYGTRFDCPTAPGCVGQKDGPKHACSRRIEPHPEERAILREVGQRLVSGSSMRQVLLWLHEQGATTRRGNPWSRSSLTTTLESETSAEHVFTLAERRALVARLHPQEKKDRPTGGRPVSWLLSGYGTCAGCGSALTTSRDARRDVTRYVCPTTTSIKPCPARVTIRADRVDALLEEAFLERWGEHVWYDERVTIDGTNLDAAERAHEEARAALLANLTAENLAAAQAAEAAFDAAKAAPVVRRREVVATDTYAEQWARADVPGRAALIHGATNSVSIARSNAPAWDPERVTIVWADEVD